MVSKAVLKTQPDGKLARLAAAGSEPAFEAIVHRYRRPLLGYCRRLRLSDNRSEDVVQQTFLNAWGSLREGTEVRELRPWLYRITHNQAVTMMRAAGRDETPLTDLASGPVALTVLEMSESTWAAADVYERQARLKETLTAVAALPALQREALLATAVDGLSYDQVAVALNTSSDAVRGLVYRARNTLRTGVAVLSPAPLVMWAANQAGQAVNATVVQQWMTEAAAGGGSVGIGAVAAKGAVVLASSAAVVTGTVGVGLDKHVFSSAHAGAHGALAAHPRPDIGAGRATHQRAVVAAHPSSGATASVSSGRPDAGAHAGAVSASGAARLGASLTGSGGQTTQQRGAHLGAQTVARGTGALGPAGVSSGGAYALSGFGAADGAGAAQVIGTAPAGMQMGPNRRPQGTQQQSGSAASGQMLNGTTTATTPTTTTTSTVMSPPAGTGTAAETQTTPASSATTTTPTGTSTSTTPAAADVTTAAQS